VIVALLRGINVGGSHQLPMASLRDGLTARGCTGVVTYIQSGNLVLDLPPAVGDADAWLTSEISAIAGFPVPTTTRTATELEGIVASNPYPAAGGTTLHVTFFAAAPSVEMFAAIDVAALAPEAFTLHDRELYLHLPAGMGRAKLPVLVERIARSAAAPGTTRNWNTVTKLLELTRRARS
jgi:uncharacterized protein (DUF1697 family)